MDMFTNNIQNSNNDLNNVPGMNIPEGYEQVSQEEFIKAILAEDNYDEITKALDTLMQKNKVMNDRRYPIITTGRVENIKEDGKIMVKMVGDDSETTESVGYINQTPFTVNQNDYVKVCKQTAGDNINSWIFGVNNINNKKDALVFVEGCLNYILTLQEEINLLKESIRELANSIIVTNISVGTGTTTTTTEVAKLNQSQKSSALNILARLNNISASVNKEKQELQTINRGKKK